jgi:trehalose 6-phosphate phosphatase
MPTDVITRPSSRQVHLPEPGDLANIALLLDVDGTILDAAMTPDSVVVPESLRASLGKLHAMSCGALALVSGRLIRDLDVLFAPLRLPSIGGHGAEMRRVGGEAPQTRHRAAIDEELRNLIAALASSGPGVILEDKGSSLAVHYRLAPQMKDSLESQIARIVACFDAQDLEVMHGKAVFEIKPAVFSKGAAVRELMKLPPFSHRKPLFFGDDTTDESVFNLLLELGGTGYSVERFIPGANGTFDSPKHVRDWLADLCCRAGSNLS